MPGSTQRSAVPSFELPKAPKPPIISVGADCGLLQLLNMSMDLKQQRYSVAEYDQGKALVATQELEPGVTVIEETGAIQPSWDMHTIQVYFAHGNIHNSELQSDMMGACALLLSPGRRKCSCGLQKQHQIHEPQLRA